MADGRRGGGGFLASWLQAVAAGYPAHRRAQIRELASAQVARGRDPATITSLADLVHPAAVIEAMRFFHERAGGALPPAG